MTSELVVDVQPKEVSIALLEDKSLVELQSEGRNISFSVGNMYLGRILLGIFYFGTLTAVASCIVVTFTINFIQCYWQMYRITFRRSAWPFIRQLISPFIISILIALALIPMQYALEGMNIFVTIIAKGIISFIIFGGYIQATHEFDIIGKVRGMTRKGK